MKFIFLAMRCERVLTTMADKMFVLLSRSRQEATKFSEFLPKFVFLLPPKHHPQLFSELSRPYCTLFLRSFLNV